MPKKQQLTMDKVKQRLENHKAVADWMLKHYRQLSEKNLFELIENDYVPFNLVEFIAGILDDDLNDILTVAQNWRVKATQEDVKLPGEDGGAAAK